MTTVTLGNLNLNDGTNYFVLYGSTLGDRQTTWDEVPSYAGGANAQVNVQTGALVPVEIPMMVRGSSASDLQSKLAALWTEVDKATNTLAWNSESYTIVRSTRPQDMQRDEGYELGYIARFTLTLTRQP